MHGLQILPNVGRWIHEYDLYRSQWLMKFPIEEMVFHLVLKFVEDVWTTYFGRQNVPQGEKALSARAIRVCGRNGGCSSRIRDIIWELIIDWLIIDNNMGIFSKKKFNKVRWAKVRLNVECDWHKLYWILYWTDNQQSECMTKTLIVTFYQKSPVAMNNNDYIPSSPTHANHSSIMRSSSSDKMKTSQSTIRNRLATTWL